MIDGATYTTLRVHAMGLPDKLASDTEIIDGATASVEALWQIEIDTAEYTADNVRGILEAYKETHTPREEQQ